MFSKVLVGADLSSAFEDALACLGALRGLGTREVVLVHALGIRHLEEMKHALEPLVEPHLAAQREAVERLGLHASLEIAPGIPASEIARIARERSADLVVLGAESSRAREMLLGGVAIQLLHLSDIPVLVCGHRADPEAGPGSVEDAGTDLRGHVLYATNLSVEAERALGALEQLVRAGATRLTLVRVQGTPADRDRLEHIGKRLLLIGADDVRVETPAGVPEKEIVRLAAVREVTLVVMGTSGRGSASTLYLGSVSHGVARRSRAPVLLVPPDRLASR